MGVQINGATGNVIATKGTFSGNVGIAGTLTYEDVTDIDAVGLITARNGIEIGASPGVGASISRQGNAIFSGITTIGSKEVGAGITLSPDGDVFASGVTTSTTFVGNLTGNVTGNSDTATNANHILVADNESTNENNLIPFIEDASATGNVGLESDGDFTYNPSTGTVSATAFSGSGANYGSSGQVLTSQGSSAAPQWATAAAGITMMDQWSITSDNNKTNGQTIDTGWERSDYFFAQIGSGMSESSGVFTFPSTGIYLLLTNHAMNTSASYCGVEIKMSSDSGSSYSTVSYGQITNTNNGYHHMSLHAVVDVQNASTYRVLLEAYNSANVQYSGDSNALRNGITFIRLGDT